MAKFGTFSARFGLYADGAKPPARLGLYADDAKTAGADLPAESGFFAEKVLFAGCGFVSRGRKEVKHVESVQKTTA